MADQVLVRVVRNLTDMHDGDETWVEENERVTGMVDGGYWEILDRKFDGPPRKAVRSGKDQAEPA